MIYCDGKVRKERKEAPGGIRTLDLSITRRVFECLPLRYNHGPKRESLLGLVAMVEDVLHRVDVRRLGSGDQEGVASQRPVQIVADVGAVL